MSTVLYGLGLKDEVKGTGVFAGAIDLKREPKTGLLADLQGSAAETVVGGILFIVGFAGIIAAANSFDAR